MFKTKYNINGIVGNNCMIEQKTIKIQGKRDTKKFNSRMIKKWDFPL